MTVTGEIYKIKNNIAYIKTKRPEGCIHCENASVCGSHMTEILAVNAVYAKVGDTVKVNVGQARKTYLLLAYVFLTPVAIFFASYFLCKISPLLLLISALVTAAYFSGLKYFDKILSSATVIAEITDEIIPYSCPDKE